MTRAGRREGRRERPPLDAERLERLALFYVGRFATTRAKLAAYLLRKIGERGWGGERPPDVDGLVGRLAELGYVDDRAFATAKASALGRRGYGTRRVSQALQAAGIDEPDAQDAREIARSGAYAAALRFAERKRIGPFATTPSDPKAREKALGAMIRAGHGFDLARRFVDAAPGCVPEPDDPDA